MKNFNELLFNEMRVIPVNMDKEFNDNSLVRAITDNENLISLGFCLKPDDIIALAKTDDFSVYETVKNYVEKVDAKPMYPDFPTQVMEMDEATFRFHQMVHYFSTYGMRGLFGVDVKKGWLPDVKDTPKDIKQTVILPAKTISLIPNDEVHGFVLRKLLSKRERLTIPEKELLKYAVRNYDGEEFPKVLFKENLMDLFHFFFEEKRDDVLRSICQHTGDVLTCIRYLLTRHHYRLSTSERKRCVRLIESYPIGDFRSNLILSNKKAQNSFIVLDYLSYNKYSRNPEHRKAVKDFRDGKLRSWESGMKKLLFDKDEKVLPYIATRPGLLLRMVAWLLRLGYKEEDITTQLVENAKSLSVQTLVTLLSLFNGRASEDDENRACIRIFEKTLKARMSYMETPLKDRKVFVDEGIYDFALSAIETNNKSEEGGYIRSSLTFRIPEAVKRLRFFVYWNDEDCVDVDLHSYARDNNGHDVHIGWSDAYNSNGMVSSGDITHSDAAEYIDIDLEKTTVEAVINVIDIYSGAYSFKDIETCFAGMMAVSEIGQDVELYSPANCFFFHNLNGNTDRLDYCVIDVSNRRMQILGKENRRPIRAERIECPFSISQYLDMLFEAQGVTPVSEKEEADLTVKLDKGADISLLDNNLFMDF